jgi:hypothetical protein
VANQYRGQTPFRALGREMFLVYGVRELAEAWSALGFRRPDPLAPPVVEERDEPLVDGRTGDPVLDEQGLPTFRRRRVYLDAAGRQQRVQDAFDAAFTNPTIPDRRICVRLGLGRWEKAAGVRLSEDEFEQLCDELGLEGLSALHIAGFINATRAPRAEGGRAEEGPDPNAPGAAAASSTSSTS